MKLKLTLAAIGYLLLAGCTAITPLEKQHSGYLSDYSDMKVIDTPDGSDVMRWVSPDLKKGVYTKAIVEQVSFFPAPKTSEKVKLETLNKISNYLTAQIKSELSSNNFELTDKPGPDTLTYQIAVTGVATPLEGLQYYEVLPITLVYAGAVLAMGSRDDVVVVYLEGVVKDSVTGKEVAKSVRQGVGENLQDSDKQLDVEKVKELLNSWAKYIGEVAKKLL